MDSKPLYYFSVTELSRLIQKKEISPVEVVEAHLIRIESLEPKLNSFITLLSEEARKAAKQAEKEIHEGKSKGPLHGIPFGLKDLYYVKGILNTSGTKIFHDFIPDYDSTVALKLRKAGAILLGKLNLHPLAYGTTGENEEYGSMHNPWNTNLIAGGSSGGNGSAVASGECPFAMGSDTGGSIRIPASLCGIVGFKPTYGRISRYGMTPLAWSQDHSGPMTRNVEDCALVMNVLSGYDPKDPTSQNLPVPDYSNALNREIKGLRLGVVKEALELPIEPYVKESFWKAIDQLVDLGSIVSEVSLPLYSYASSIASIIQMAEATAYHSELIRKHGAQIFPPVRLRLESGIFISATEYIQAERARTLFCQQSLDLFKKVDLLLTPTLPTTAFPIGTTSIKIEGQKINVVSLLTQYTRPFNLNGFPALSLPCGFSETQLPIGLQIIGHPWDEETVLRTAYAYQQATEWHLKRPSL
ncbi:MAG: amidase [Thermodesulfobacteriota bacterium]